MGSGERVLAPPGVVLGILRLCGKARPWPPGPGRCKHPLPSSLKGRFLSMGVVTSRGQSGDVVDCISTSLGKNASGPYWSQRNKWNKRNIRNKRHNHLLDHPHHAFQSVPEVQAPPPTSFPLAPFVVTDLFPKNLYLKASPHPVLLSGIGFLEQEWWPVG
jgi:hypothetical protein